MDNITGRGNVYGNPDPHIRYNIIDFSTKEEYEVQWSLYVRALTVLQNTATDDPYSYYRMAAIHGKPTLNWPESGDFDRRIWCDHGRPKFLPWHRVYLYLFEQSLVKQAVILAEQAPAGKRECYIAAAKKVRQPYWDWARDADVPDVLKQDKKKVIVIKINESDEEEIPNPLHSFTFNGPIPDAPGSQPPFPKTTTRFTDDVVKSNVLIAKMRQSVYDAIVANGDEPIKGYGPFSNKLYPKTKASMEKPHDDGHHSFGIFMQNNDVAGFDPIFWFHHAAIDRYYALWQAINPAKPWEENSPQAKTIEEALLPFVQPSGESMWTSLMVQYVDNKFLPNHYQYGVEYPELLVVDKEEIRKQKARLAVLKYYSPAVRVELRIVPKSVGHYPSGCIPKSKWTPLTGAPPDLPDAAGVRREWRVATAVRMNLVVGNFTVFFFLGEPGSPSEWGTNETTVGSFSTFKGDLETCEGCQDRDGELMYGSINLTEDLFRLKPPPEDPKDLGPVCDFLTKNLSWRVRKADGTEYPLPAGDPRFGAIVESYLEAYAPIDDDGNPVDEDGNALEPSLLGDILGKTSDHKQHPEITPGTPNYH